MIVMGGIIGSGIFINPYVVAKVLKTPGSILAAWCAGGLIALAGAFIYAELAALRPDVGGQYAYLREAFHPGLAFIYGWTLLLVVQSGGMAAVAVTFARYFLELTRAGVSDRLLGATALVVLTMINCVGVRAGSSVQNALMVLKLIAIAGLVVFGLTVSGGSESSESLTATQAETHNTWTQVTAFGAALVPVLFAYGGWQTASFIAGEVREPRKNLPRGMMLGVAGVILLYLLVNYLCVTRLGVQGLAATTTPASEVMRLALGERGAKLIAVGIAISTLGFLSQSILTAPRVYFAMASDGLFFKSVAWLSSRTRVPVVAIALQGTLAIVIALTGSYERILNYVVSMDSTFFALTAVSLLVLRRKAVPQSRTQDGKTFHLRVPVVVIAAFALAEFAVALNTINTYRRDSAIGLLILVTGIPVYLFWRRKQKPI